MSITGTYKMIIPGPGGNPEFTLIMKECKKGVVTGTLADNKNIVELTKSIASGNLFTFYADFSRVLKAPEGSQKISPAKFVFRGLGFVEGDRIKFAMFADEQDFMLDVEGKRVN